MSVTKAVYTITCGTRTVEFYPLLLKHAKEVSITEVVDGDSANAAYASLMKTFLLSAQRGNPAVTMDDIEAVVDLQNRDELVKAITGRGVKVLDAGEAVPTSPLNGGTSTGPSSPLPGGLTQ